MVGKQTRREKTKLRAERTKEGRDKPANKMRVKTCKGNLFTSLQAQMVQQHRHKGPPGTSSSHNQYQNPPRKSREMLQLVSSSKSEKEDDVYFSYTIHPKLQG